MSTDPLASPYGYERMVLYDPVNKRITFLDPVDGGVLPTVDLEKSMIHRQAFFTTVIKEEKMKPSDTKYIYLATPNEQVEIHFSGEISVNKPTFVNFYESPTVTSLGTPVTAFNNDRNSNKEATMKVYENPTVSNLGTLYLSAYVQEKNTPKNKTILKKGTGYLAEIKPENNNTTVIVVFTWYEADR